MNFDELSKTNEQWRFLRDSIFNQGIPMVPFPDVSNCLGMNPKDSIMKIKEGYVIMAFDYNVVGSNEKCLFNIK